MIQYQRDLEGIAKDQLAGFFVGWKKSLTPQEHLQILKNSEFVVLAIDMETNMVIGFVNALSDNINFAFIPMLEVLPPYQGRGIGTNLMKAILAELEGISCVDLSCDQELQPFYEKFGLLRSQGMIKRDY